MENRNYCTCGKSGSDVYCTGICNPEIVYSDSTTMNTPQQEKAAYFAQYWGQTVISDVDNSGVRQLYPVEQSNMYRIEESHLLLTPLSLITDEDAIEVAKLRGFVNVSRVKFVFEGYWITWKREGKRSITKFVFYRDMNQPEIDFLRSKGYALPWGKYSIEQLIELGWLRLRTETDE